MEQAEADAVTTLEERQSQLEKALTVFGDKEAAAKEATEELAKAKKTRKEAQAAVVKASSFDYDSGTSTQDKQASACDASTYSICLSTRDVAWLLILRYSLRLRPQKTASQKPPRSFTQLWMKNTRQ